MAKGLDKEFIRESYAKRSNQELQRIISQDAHGLTPEAVEVIKEELARRNMDPTLVNIVAAQNKTYTREEIDEFCRIIESLPCPKCKTTSSPITAIVIYRAMSFIYITHYRKKLAIGCPQCLRTDNNADLALTVALG